jgi:hypothetical protein
MNKAAAFSAVTFEMSGTAPVLHDNSHISVEVKP